MKTLASVMICALAFGIGSAQESFVFRPHQSVYIVAVRGNIGDPSLSTLDLAAEKEIREGFKKRNLFNIAPSLSKADFVFLCITEYMDNTKTSLLRNVLAIAVNLTTSNPTVPI